MGAPNPLEWSEEDVELWAELQEQGEYVSDSADWMRTQLLAALGALEAARVELNRELARIVRLDRRVAEQEDALATEEHLLHARIDALQRAGNARAVAFARMADELHRVRNQLTAAEHEAGALRGEMAVRDRLLDCVRESSVKAFFVLGEGETGCWSVEWRGYSAKILPEIRELPLWDAIVAANAAMQTAETLDDAATRERGGGDGG